MRFLKEIEVKKKDAFPHRGRRCLQQMRPSSSRRLPAQNASLFSTFPICLSRACLGKLIVFSIHMAPKQDARLAPSCQPYQCPAALWCRRSHQQPSEPRRQRRTRPACRNVSVSNFPHVCPEPALAKIRFQYKLAHDRKMFSAP
jgi:hypothetical protein